jgi:excisionase family DNA binding protein
MDVLVYKSIQVGQERPMETGKPLSTQRARARKQIRDKHKKLAESQRRTISVEEAARQLGISRTSAYTYANDGLIPTIKLGDRLLVPKAAFERLLEGTQDA